MARVRTVAAVAVVAVGLVVPGLASGQGADPQGGPTHSVAAGGTGVSTYPAFDPAVDRYAVRTTEATAGTITVTASTTDPGGTITVDGRPLPESGEVTLDGVDAGDEVAVRIDDDLGTSTYGLIVLPPGFPLLTAASAGDGPGEGLTYLGLIRFFPGPVFEVVVDEHGVPVHVRSGEAGTFGVNDFKRQGAERSTVFRPTTTEGRSGQAMHVLGPAFEELSTHETVGRVNTDFHDGILNPDGSMILIAYEGLRPGVIDAVIQELDPQGNLVFEWTSEDHVPLEDALVSPLGDYVHINSVDVMANGDWLASMRNTSQVLRIARTAHDGFEAGDVVWRLGGLSNDFTFVDDPHGGPCAQHTAYELANGNILLFDNGGEEDADLGAQTGDFCPDPNDPTARIARPQSRAVEYALDEDAMTATMVWSHEPTGRYSPFAGSTQRLANGNTLIGWADDAPVATEVAPDGEVVWSLSSDLGYLTYRAHRAPAPDAVDPGVDPTVPAEGAVYERGEVVIADYGCSDRGGSTLQDCAGPAASGTAIDTSTPGPQEFTVTATDGSGNTTEVSHTYEVSARRPDARIRRAPNGVTVGDDLYNDTGIGQSRSEKLNPGARRHWFVTVQNDGDEPEAFRLRGQQSTPNYTVRYRAAGVDVTAALRAGTFQTPELAPGEARAVRVTVIAGPRAPRGSRIERLVTATSVNAPTVGDTVRVVVTRR